MQKTIQTRPEYFIQFTEDEATDLGLEIGDVLDVSVKDDGILLQKLVPLELDMTEFPREVLERLVKESTEKNVSVNQIITTAIKTFIDNNEDILDFKVLEDSEDLD
jgi:hypothetical protein